MKQELKGMLKDLPNKESLTAIIEYSIYVSDKGDYVLQALTIADLNPRGF
jgi:hypothetical protein